MSYKLWKGQFPLSHILALFFSESLSFCLKLLYLCFFCNIDSWIAAISKSKFMMHKDWTFLLNVQRNAKKGKRAKDMSWIVNATGWSRLASPISLKQCTHPLRRVCARVILDIVGVQFRRQRWWEQRSKISTYWQYSPPASPALRCITRPASSSTQPRPPKNVPTRPKKSRLRHYWIFVSHNSQSPKC